MKKEAGQFLPRHKLAARLQKQKRSVSDFNIAFEPFKHRVVCYVPQEQIFYCVKELVREMFYSTVKEIARRRPASAQAYASSPTQNVQHRWVALKPVRFQKQYQNVDCYQNYQNLGRNNSWNRENTPRPTLYIVLYPLLPEPRTSF